MNRNMDAVTNTNTNSDHDPDFKTFWKQLHQKCLVRKAMFNVQRNPRQQIDCYSVTPKRVEYWDMAIEAGFTFYDLESMKRHKRVALSPHVLLKGSLPWGCGWMYIRSLKLEFGSDDQLGEEDKQAIRFVLRLAAKHPLKSPFGDSIQLTQYFVETKQLHDIPLVTHRVDLNSCDLVDCDKLMFNISQNSKYVVFSECKLADEGVDLWRWLSPNNCSITEVSFFRTRVTCESLAKLFQSNKRINKLYMKFDRNYNRQRTCSQEIDQIIQLLSDASHLKKLRVYNLWDGSSRQAQMTRFDALISLLGNKSLPSLTYYHSTDPSMFEVPPETFSAQMEALRQALEQTTQLTYLHIRPRPPDKYAHSYNALVERILRRNHRNKVRAVLCSLPTWSQPLALFGEMLMRTSKHRSRMAEMAEMGLLGLIGTMDPMSETFNVLLQGSEALKRAWDDKREDRLVRVDDASACGVEKKGTSTIDAILDGLGVLWSSSN